MPVFPGATCPDTLENFGGFTPATCDALGNPTGFHLSPGQGHDLQGANAQLPALIDQIKAPLGDKAYDAQE